MANKNNRLVLMAAATAVLALASCGASKGKSDTEEGGTYTYRDALQSTPDTWNVHTWKENTESLIQGYTEMGLYDFVLGEGGLGYQIVPEMADGEPIDDSANITADEISLYGITTNKDLGIDTNPDAAAAGTKWLIKLNQAACWEDGTKITADDYVESASRLLDPAMANFRADNFYSGTMVVANAEGRFKSGRTVYESVVNGDDGSLASHAGTLEGDHFYGSLYETIPWLGYSIGSLYSSYGSYLTGATKAAIEDTATWGTSSSPKFVDLGNAESPTAAHDVYLNVLKEVLSSALFGLDASLVTDSYDTEADAKQLCLGYWVFQAFKNKDVPFADVGIKKVGDYEIALYLVSPVTEFNLKYSLSSNWLVKTDLYDKLKTTTGSLVSTTYATSADSYMSYGPYRLKAFLPDKEIALERNDKWYGYTDGKHKGQFSITDIDFTVVPKIDTQLTMFENGKLDAITLRSQDMKKYATSPYLVYTPQSYTDKIALNSNLNKLISREKSETSSKNDGNTYNKRILANTHFRQALSWAVDRMTFCQQETTGSTPALGVINKLYVADEETGVLYRDTEAGKRVISDIYGDSKDGFNKAQAQKLIKEACEETYTIGSTESKYYNAGEKVDLEFVVYNEGWRTAIENHIQDFKDATVGTPLEGNFTVTITITENNQDTILAGNAEMCMDIWGGAQMDPYGIPNTWIAASNRTCYGFDPDTEKIAIDLDGDGKIGDGENLSNTEWYNQLNKGKYAAGIADVETRELILSYLEEYMLQHQYFIAIRSRNAVGINSFRVKEGTDEYQALVGYGGIREMKLTQSDSAWDARAAKGLDYTK